MKLKIVHKTEEGEYWADMPAIPEGATRGENFNNLLSNIYEAVEDCLSDDKSALINSVCGSEP